MDCSSGDPDICEGSYELDITDLSDQSDMLNGSLLLTSSNEFGYHVQVTSLGEDTAISPTLIIRLPQQTRLSGTVSMGCGVGVVLNTACATLE